MARVFATVLLLLSGAACAAEPASYRATYRSEIGEGPRAVEQTERVEFRRTCQAWVTTRSIETRMRSGDAEEDRNPSRWSVEISTSEALDGSTLKVQTRNFTNGEPVGRLQTYAWRRADGRVEIRQETEGNPSERDLAGVLPEGVLFPVAELRQRLEQMAHGGPVADALVFAGRSRTLSRLTNRRVVAVDAHSQMQATFPALAALPSWYLTEDSTTEIIPNQTEQAGPVTLAIRLAGPRQTTQQIWKNGVWGSSQGQGWAFHQQLMMLEILPDEGC